MISQQVFKKFIFLHYYLQQIEKIIIEYIFFFYSNLKQIKHPTKWIVSNILNFAHLSGCNTIRHNLITEYYQFVVVPVTQLVINGHVDTH